MTVPFDITDPVVNELVYGSPISAGGQVNAPESTNWDCSIGNLTFLFGINDANKFVRETAEFRRQRIDTERDPGEQSLDSGYWIRSQSSWHYGSGLSSAEPLETNAEEARFRFYQSGGIDPWTPGQLSLLNAASSVYSASATRSKVQGVGTGVLYAANASLTYVPTTGAASAVSYGDTTEILSLTDTGQYYIVSNAAGIWRGDLPQGAGTKIYNKAAAGTPTYSLIRWVKDRLMYAEDASIREITNLTPTSATLPAALFTHPNSSWRWTDFADGPTAIYASGYSKELSTIYRIGINTTTTTVTLNQPVVVAEMPRGEDILSMYSYVGSFLIVGTTLGVRVAAIQSDGSLVMGPLLVEAGPVDDAVALGSFVYVTVRDKGNAGNRALRAGLYRIDLGQTLDNNQLKFAHAADLTVPAGVSGQATSVTVAGSTLYFGVPAAGVFKQLTTFVDEGWIETGRIRLGTVEKKGWRDLRLLAEDGTRGTVTAFASTDDANPPDSWTELISVGDGVYDRTGKLNAAAPAPATNMHLGFRFRTNPECTCSARMIGYQLRAVPAPERTRLISVPILLFDFVTDRKGMRVGREGFAWDTLQKLQQLETTAAVVQWRDFTTGEAATVYVERVSFSRETPPTNRAAGSGGIATVLLRLV